MHISKLFSYSINYKPFLESIHKTSPYIPTQTQSKTHKQKYSTQIFEVLISFNIIPTKRAHKAGHSGIVDHEKGRQRQIVRESKDTDRQTGRQEGRDMFG